MVYKAKSSKGRYEELLKDPLLFCLFSQRTIYSDLGTRFSKSGWFSLDDTIELYIDENDLEEGEYDKKLFVIGKQLNETDEIEQKKESGDSIIFEVEEFNVNNCNHWLKIFNDCIYNFKAGNTRHCHMILIWALFRTSWLEPTLAQALTSINPSEINIVTSSIHNCLATFSIEKQTHIVNVLKSYLPQITPLIYPNIEEALKSLSPNNDFKDFSLFDKIEFILVFGVSDEERDILKSLYQTSRNCYIHFKYWYDHPGHKLFNYDLVEEIYSYLDPQGQLLIVKRYLHDIRLKVVNLDILLLTNLRDQRYKTLIDTRYFIDSAGSNIELVAPMFCDAVLTIQLSGGKKIQDFNGLLDFAVSHSNRAYPNIDLGIEHFLSSCDGGLKHNPSFIGFIHYTVVYEFDESLLTDENLKSTAEYILDNNANLQYHHCCALTGEELDINTLSHCQSTLKKIKEINKNGVKEKIKENISCSGVSYERYKPDRWSRKDENSDKLLSLCIENVNLITSFFTFNNVSLNRLKNNLQNWASKHKTFVYQNDIIPKDVMKQPFLVYLRTRFYKPVKIKLYPYQKTYLASKKSLLGLWNIKDIDVRAPNFNTSVEETAQTSESPEVFKRTFDALKKKIPNAMVNNDGIEIPYSKEDLNAAKDYFYCRPHFSDKQDNENREFRKFLAPRHRYNTHYCTPKLANSCEKVSGLPFFWCGSEECFCNVLDKWIKRTIPTQFSGWVMAEKVPKRNQN